VTHEALIQHWPHLKNWVDTNREFLAWQQRLNATMKRWERSQKPVGLLLRGLPLKEALGWLNKNSDRFSNDEHRFVLASRERSTKVYMAASIGIGLLLWLIGGTTWLWQKGYNLDQAAFKIQSLVTNIHVMPLMVRIPGGRFQQGDVEWLGKSSGDLVRTVTIKSFAMGQYEVTFEEYDRFAIAEGRPLPSDQGWGRGKRPAINVSWDDAKAYAKWLSVQTHTPYRLPTESEWEYAARSGAKQELWAGTSEQSKLEKYAVFVGNSKNSTAEVGTRWANGFGLHDLSGNVWEWVEDCKHSTYDQAPQDGSPWLEQNEGDCSWRVLRGGSWYLRPEALRAANRSWDTTGYRYQGYGFRLAKDLVP
jgi:formylglycine-generating enzyme required for sulfatase activity